MRQRLAICVRITPPTTHWAILLVLSVFVAVMLGTLALAVDLFSLQALLATGLQGDRLTLVALALPVILVALAIWKGLCLLTDGSFEYIETGPEGLVVCGLFGLRHRPWEEIDRFTVAIVPMADAIVRVTAWPTPDSNHRPLRFFLNGYFKTGWLDDIGGRQEAVADWLLRILAAYSRGTRDGSLPIPPVFFIGRMIDLPPGSVAAKVAVVSESRERT